MIVLYTPIKPPFVNPIPLIFYTPLWESEPRGTTLGVLVVVVLVLLCSSLGSDIVILLLMVLFNFCSDLAIAAV